MTDWDWDIFESTAAWYIQHGILTEARIEELRLTYRNQAQQTREARMEEIERRRDSVLAECNPDLPTYDPR